MALDLLDTVSFLIVFLRGSSALYDTEDSARISCGTMKARSTLFDFTNCGFVELRIWSEYNYAVSIALTIIWRGKPQAD